MSTASSHYPQLGTVSAKDTRKATSIAFLGWSVAIYDFILFGTLLPRIEEDFGWSTGYALFISTLVSVGTFIVIMALGPVIDWVGRKRGMTIAVTGTAVASGLTALTTGPVSLVGVRAISGMSLAEQSVNATYLNEIYERTESKWIKKHQGFVYAIVQTGWPVGALLAAAFVAIIMGPLGVRDWRIIFVIATLPALIVAGLTLTLKETPQFQILKQIKELRNAGNVVEAQRLADATGLEIPAKMPLSRIFQGANLRTTIVLSIAWIFNWIAIQTFSVLGTTVLETGKGLSAQSALLMIVGSNVMGAAGYLTHGWLGDKFGRKRVIVFGWAVGGIIFAIMLLGPSNPAFVLITYMIGLFFLLGPYSALLFLQAECYEADCRATGSTFVGAMSQPGAIVGGALLSVLVTAGVTFNMAALVVGAVGAFLSGMTMMLVKSVGPDDTDAHPVDLASHELPEMSELVQEEHVHERQLP